jgi:lauroyl/myristoyl acyltransferase
MVCNWNSSVATLLLADRLREPAWQERLRVVGQPLDRMTGWGHRPFILVFLHTGGFAILRHWLRSQGHPAVSYVASMPEILKSTRAQAIYAAADKRNGLAGLRHWFDGSRDLRATRKFLVPGHILTMALDAGMAASSPEVYYADGNAIQLHSGAVRLAALSGACLVPVSITNQGALSFDIRFGKPVPQELLDESAPRAAMQLLVDDLWTNVDREPSSLGWTTLEALAPDLRKKHLPWP